MSFPVPVSHLSTAARMEWWNLLLSGGKIHTSTFCMDLFCIPRDNCESTALSHSHSHPHTPWAVLAVSPGTSGQYASAHGYTPALESFAVSSRSKSLLPFSSFSSWGSVQGWGMVWETTLWARSQCRAVSREVSRASPQAVSSWEQQEQPGAEPSPCSRTDANGSFEHPKWQHIPTCARWGGLPQALPAAFLYT